MTLGSLTLKQLRSDLISYNTLIAACPRQEWCQALRVLSLCLKSKILGDVVTFSTAINAHSEATSWQAATNLFYQHVQGSSVACSTVMKTFRPLGRWLQALAVGKFFLAESHIVANAWLSTCQQRGIWEMSLLVLRCMLRPGQISYTSLLSACDAAYKWQVGIQLLCRMHEARVAPDIACANAAMSAAATSSKWEFARVLQKDMCMNVLVADSGTNAVAMDAIARSGYWKQAIHALMSHKHKGQVMYNSAHAACEKACCWRHSLRLSYLSLSFRLELDDCSLNSAITSCAGSRLGS